MPGERTDLVSVVKAVSFALTASSSMLSILSRLSSLEWHWTHAMSRCARWSKRLETNHRRGAMGMPVGSVVWSATGLIAGRGLALGAGGGAVGAPVDGAAVLGAGGVDASGVVAAAGG